MMAQKLSRKAFLRMVVGVVAAGAALEACGSDAADSTAAADSTSTASTCRNGAKDGGIDDPKHHLVVPAADIITGRSKTYSIQGTETHDHKITLEAADFAKLASHARVFVTSTRDVGHTHTFFVVCA
jgi:hypothetical protein